MLQRIQHLYFCMPSEQKPVETDIVLFSLVNKSPNSLICVKGVILTDRAFHFYLAFLSATRSDTLVPTSEAKSI